MANVPTIIINGEEIKPAKPKVKLWRSIVKMNELQGKEESEEFLDSILSVICEAFKNPKVTPESVEENLDLEEFMPLFSKIAAWVGQTVGGKLEQIPNTQTPTAR